MPTMRHLLAFLLLLASLPAQAVRLHNSAATPFSGWLRRTVLPTAQTRECGLLPDGTTYVLGRKIGLVGRVLDLRVTLAAGEDRTVDLARAAPATWQPGLAPDPLNYYGQLSLAGLALPILDIAVDGAAVVVHARGRPAAGLWAECWFQIYRDQAFAQGELVLTAGDPASPALSAACPTDLRLACGAATVLVPGLPVGSPLLPAGEQLADGQCRAWPVVLLWTNHAGDTTAPLQSAAALANMQIGAVGNLRPSPTGQWPEVPNSFDARAWISINLPGAIARLHSWDAGPLGVVAASGDAGDQEDQGYMKGGETQAANGAGAELVSYLVALGQLRRPCHLLEASGALLSPAAHPQCVVWSGRPDPRLGSDLLGKPALPATWLTTTHGWLGPDRQHWLMNRLAAAYELTGSYALQWELRAQANLFLLGETIDPALSTSHADAARAVGWTGLVLCYLHDLLEDRALAASIDARYLGRIAIYARELGGRPAWDVSNDPRWLMDVGLPYTTATAPYQQAVGCWGLAMASVKVGSATGWMLAQAGARGVCDLGYSMVGPTWTEWDEVGLSAGVIVQPVDIAEGAGGHRTGWFAEAWFPMGSSLASFVGYSRGAAIWQQNLATARSHSTLPMTWYPR